MCFPASQSFVVLQGKFTWRHQQKRDGWQGPSASVMRGACVRGLKQNLGIWVLAGKKNSLVPQGAKSAVGERRLWEPTAETAVR